MQKPRANALVSKALLQQEVKQPLEALKALMPMPEHLLSFKIAALKKQMMATTPKKDQHVFKREMAKIEESLLQANSNTILHFIDSKVEDIQLYADGKPKTHLTSKLTSLLSGHLDNYQLLNAQIEDQQSLIQDYCKHLQESYTFIGVSHLAHLRSKLYGRSYQALIKKLSCLDSILSRNSQIEAKDLQDKDKSLGENNGVRNSSQKKRVRVGEQPGRKNDDNGGWKSRLTGVQEAKGEDNGALHHQLELKLVDANEAVASLSSQNKYYLEKYTTLETNSKKVLMDYEAIHTRLHNEIQALEIKQTAMAGVLADYQSKQAQLETQVRKLRVQKASLADALREQKSETELERQLTRQKIGFYQCSMVRMREQHREECHSFQMMLQEMSRREKKLIEGDCNYERKYAAHISEIQLKLKENMFSGGMKATARQPPCY